MSPRDLVSALVEWSVGLAAAVTAASLAKKLVVQEHLTALGWALLLVSTTLFLILLIRLARFQSEEERRHRRILSPTKLAQDPENFIRTARARANDLPTLLGTWNPSMETHKSLEDLSDRLKIGGSTALSNPRLLEAASAYFGEVLREGLGGRWKSRSLGRRRYAVVVLGKGRLRHEVSPSRWVLRTIEDQETRLEDVYQHEERELS